MESQFVSFLEMQEIILPVKKIIEGKGFESEELMFSPDTRFDHAESIKRNSTIYKNVLRKNDLVITYNIEVTKKNLGQGGSECSAFYKMGLKLEKAHSSKEKSELIHMIEGRTFPLRALDSSVAYVFEKTMQPRLYEVLNHKL